MLGPRSWALGLVCVLIGSSSGSGREPETLGGRMIEAAERFLNQLTPEQRAKACFSFDDAERFRFAFVPLEDAEHRPTRKGLPLSEMTEAQRRAAMDLVRTGVSPKGFAQVQMVIELEAMLDQYENPKRFTRNPGWYFVSIFGKPGPQEIWGWRIDGHHLSLNVTLKHGEVIAATPAFFGANPAEIKYGPRTGHRTLADSEDPALELFGSLSEEQKRIAYRAKHFPEPTQFAPAEKVGEPVGLSASALTPAQKALLEKLVRNYLDRMAPAIAEQQWRGVLAGGFDRIHFAFSGGTKPGESRTYRVHGTNFIIQFLNTQGDVHGNPANHIHSIWRELPRDFGLDRLGAK